MTVLLIAAVSALASTFLTRQVLSYLLRRGVLDRPTPRSSHIIPTPRGGGLAIVLVVVAGFSVSAAAAWHDSRIALTLSVGTVVLGSVGWIDDIRGLGSRARLLVHFAVAGMTTALLGGLPSLQLGLATIPLGMLGGLLATVGIVWAINLFNFMDGIDGLAGSQALIIFLSFAFLFLVSGDGVLACLAAVIGGASAGFLVWNWPPARVFMGDVGSGVLGYLAGTLMLASENRGAMPLVALAAITVLFIGDATVTLLRRIARGASPSEAHRDHAYQRLARHVGGHRPVTIAAAIVTFALALMAAPALRLPEWTSVIAVVAALVLALILFFVERRAPFGSQEHS